MQNLLSLGLTLTLASSLLAADKPNIVYIIVDDLGIGDLSCYGQKNFQTPHIDSLAKEGMLFSAHYSGSTVCAPARSSLMTGQDQGHTYIRGNGAHELRKSDTTFAHLLKQAGYTTGMVGKSCVTGNTKNPQAPHNSGFDYFYGTLSHVTAHHHWPTHIFEQGKKKAIPGNKTKSGTVYIQDRYTEKGLEFIEANKQKPFALLLSYSAPHADIDVPMDSVTPFLGKFDPEVRYKGGHYKACNHVKATYAGMVTRLDKHVGSILAKLKELDLDENTIVSFTSDNGPTKAGGYHWDFHNSNGKLRGGKRDLYEGGIRVPFLVRWPAKIKPASITHHPSAFWDVLPTFCDIAQVTPPKNIQGISFLPTLTGSTQPAHPYLYWEFHEKGGKVALRKDHWKIVRLNMHAKSPSPYELYNLIEDPSETSNIAEKHPEKLQELTTLLENHRQKSPIKKWNFR
ncbi:arylsulfatase [Rubritalea tangerina]|uniref:Arylsulfatase n=1 Tax=Rubritalea tangerina TaxID=430798 RepID=A0ABW4ZB99_9BACT